MLFFVEPLSLLAMALVPATPIVFWWGAGAFLSGLRPEGWPQDLTRARRRIAAAACVWMTSSVFVVIQLLTILGRVMGGPPDLGKPRPDPPLDPLSLTVFAIACVAASWWAAGAVKEFLDDPEPE